MKKFVMLIGCVVLGTQLGWAAGGGGSEDGAGDAVLRRGRP